jgi:hypothetical protein
MGKGMKNLIANAVSKKASFAARKAGKFVQNQLKHPSVKNLAKDSAKIALKNYQNPGEAANMISDRVKQEGANILDRTEHNLDRL